MVIMNQHLFILIIMFILEIKAADILRYTLEEFNSNIYNNIFKSNSQPINTKVANDSKMLNFYLTNLGNAIYEASSYVGSNSQGLKLLINTGETYSWLTNKTCTNCTVSYNYFDKSLSTTYKSLDKQISIPFSKNINFYMNGVLSQDSIRIVGMEKGFNYQFALMDSMNGTVNLPLDGGIGLGPVSSATPENSFIYSLKQSGLIDNQIFSIYTGSQEQNSLLPV